MPQIDQVLVSYASQIGGLLVVLALIYFGIARTILPKVQGTIDARAKRVSDDIAAADAAHEKADEIEETYRTQLNEARADANVVTAEAKAKAAAETAERVAAAGERLDTRLAAAEASLAKARTAALAEIEGVATGATRDIVARISGNQVTEAEARAAVAAEMAHG